MLTLRTCGLLAGAVLLLLGPGCSRPHHNRTMGDLVQHFQAHGLKGEFRVTMPGLAGSKEGGNYTGQDFRVLLFLFEEESRAQSLEKTGWDGQPCHRNGKFIMVVRSGEAKVLPVFQRF